MGFHLILIGVIALVCYVAFYAWRGDLHMMDLEWHEKYGEIVRFGPNSLSFNSSKAVSDIYAVRANVQKSEGYASMSPSRYTPNTLTAISRNIHTFKRRILAQAFSDQSIKDMEDRIQEKISSFVNNLLTDTNSESGWSSPKNISQMCDWLAFDIITDLSYGNDLDMLNSTEMRWFPSVIRKISQRSLIGLFQPYFIKFRLDCLLLRQKYKEILAAARWTRSQSAARMEVGNNSEQKDIFNAMLNARDKKTGLQFTRKDLGLESMLLLVAGSDTTATALSATLYYIIHDSNILAHLTRVIRMTFPAESSITASSVLASPDCSVLRACINEAMRLTPPAPNLLPRKVLSGGMEVDGIYVPAGTIVGVAAYTVHRNETYFHDADRFEPGRWLDGNETSQQKMQMAFVPFSVGPRKCVAWRLAWAEVNLAIARVLWRYDLRLARNKRCCKEDTSCEYDFKAGVTTAVDGPVIELRPRIA
ncbi:cytochrome P450 [Aspergillus vadensis CBS 113365]|uniref:Cytochrome P450 monooxygenase n=1 Tax=Aspergillus vadensis (strain CBS 113365 / IMI 142717 / IBT 24658) TaxID=1448311 RepID=A0A319BLH1_ASPVC|nr:cytochrome P450 monooxygenase [Aspergillus vadensis CBS 113365]PYH73174.1 cytochrome P450 monooxygenase [Aspergillus vadensis CBS 113365]